MKLGKVLKDAGFQPDFVIASEHLAVEWYTSVGELIRGLEKNTFAGADYRCSMVLVGVAMLVGGYVLPYVGMFVAPWPANLLFGIAEQDVRRAIFDLYSERTAEPCGHI